jgi:hypothetical protein
MTQPPQPGRLAPPPGAPAGTGGAASGARPPGRADGRPDNSNNGGFQYDKVTPGVRPGTLPPPPESASPTSTIAPPPAYAPPGAPGPGGPGNPGNPLRPPAPGAPVGPGQPGTPAANGAPGAVRRPPAPGRSANARSPRRARLQLRHINPWTVFKFACALSIALFFIWLLTVAALYGILDATGVIGRINDAWTTVQGGDTSPPIRPSIVLLGATVIGAVNIVLFIALSTIGSIIYNLCADIIGGVEVTLSEPEA